MKLYREHVYLLKCFADPFKTTHKQIFEESLASTDVYWQICMVEKLVSAGEEWTRSRRE